MKSAIQNRWNAAQRLASQRDWKAAKSAFLEILAAQPDHAPALLQLSYIESLTGSYRAARDHALRAFRSRPVEPKIVAELIARLRTFNEAGAIDSCAKRLPPLTQVDIRLLLSFAAQFSYLNQQERAMVFLDEAKRGDPEFPPTLVARGQVLTYLGRFSEAENDLRRCVARAPELAQAHWSLGRLKKATTGEGVDRIREAIRRFPQGPDGTALLHYALHKQLDDLGDYEGAWIALERACVAKRASLQYSQEETRLLFDKLRSIPLASAAAPADESSAIPIFIVGMHRSGTTLLEQMLGTHEQVQPLGELYDFTGQMRFATDHHCRGVIDSTIVDRVAGLKQFDNVGNGYLASVQWRVGRHSHFTDKLPSNFLNLGFVCSATPTAKVLHMTREPMETAFSNLRELFSDANAYSYDQNELVDYYQNYNQLMKCWHKKFPGRILDVDYASLIRSPVATMKMVSEFCGLTPNPGGSQDGKAIDTGVATASAVQVREGIQVRSVPKWRPYAEHLQVLQSGLAAIT